MTSLFNSPQCYAEILFHAKILISDEKENETGGKIERQIDQRIYNNALCGLLRNGYPFEKITDDGRTYIRIEIKGNEFLCPEMTVSNILREEYAAISEAGTRTQPETTAQADTAKDAVRENGTAENADVGAADGGQTRNARENGHAENGRETATGGTETPGKEPGKEPDRPGRGTGNGKGTPNPAGKTAVPERTEKAAADVKNGKDSGQAKHVSDKTDGRAANTDNNLNRTAPAQGNGNNPGGSASRKDLDAGAGTRNRDGKTRPDNPERAKNEPGPAKNQPAPAQKSGRDNSLSENRKEPKDKPGSRGTARKEEEPDDGYDRFLKQFGSPALDDIFFDPPKARETIEIEDGAGTDIGADTQPESADENEPLEYREDTGSSTEDTGTGRDAESDMSAAGEETVVQRTDTPSPADNRQDGRSGANAKKRDPYGAAGDGNAEKERAKGSAPKENGSAEENTIRTTGNRQPDTAVGTENGRDRAVAHSEGMEQGDGTRIRSEATEKRVDDRYSGTHDSASRAASGRNGEADGKERAAGAAKVFRDDDGTETDHGSSYDGYGYGDRNDANARSEGSAGTSAAGSGARIRRDGAETAPSDTRNVRNTAEPAPKGTVTAENSRTDSREANINGPAETTEEAGGGRSGRNGAEMSASREEASDSPERPGSEPSGYGTWQNGNSGTETAGYGDGYGDDYNNGYTDGHNVNAREETNAESALNGDYSVREEPETGRRTAPSGNTPGGRRFHAKGSTASAYEDPAGTQPEPEQPDPKKQPSERHSGRFARKNDAETEPGYDNGTPYGPEQAEETVRQEEEKTQKETEKQKKGLLNSLFGRRGGKAKEESRDGIPDLSALDEPGSEETEREEAREPAREPRHEPEPAELSREPAAERTEREPAAPATATTATATTAATSAIGWEGAEQEPEARSYAQDGGTLYVQIHKVMLKKIYAGTAFGPYRFIFWPTRIMDPKPGKYWGDFLVHITDPAGNETIMATDAKIKELTARIDNKDFKVYALWNDGKFESHVSLNSSTASMFTLEEETFDGMKDETPDDDCLDQFRFERKGQPKHFVVPFRNANRGELNIPIIGYVELDGKKYMLDRREGNTLRYRHHGNEKVIRGHWEDGKFRFVVEDAMRHIWDNQQP